MKRLDDAKLVTVNRDGSGELVSLDAHPLLREYFARRLRKEQPGAWREGHRRLYEHLVNSTPDKPAPTLEDLQPLHYAIAHGCLADLHGEAYALYHRRILRGNEFYNTDKLGAFGTALGTLASFFETPWRRVSANLNEVQHSWLLNSAAFILRSLGRLTEAIEPLRAAIKLSVKNDDFQSAAVQASNLSEIELTLGKVSDAMKDAELSITYADHNTEKGRERFESIGNRTTLADALNTAGRLTEAEGAFREAEQRQVKREPNYPLLYSLQGFRYCNFLLGSAEHAAWRRMLEHDGYSLTPAQRVAEAESRQTLRSVYERATETHKWMKEWSGASLLTLVADKLTLSRVAFYDAVLSDKDLPQREIHSRLKQTLDETVQDLRNTGVQLYLPLGLLTRAWLRFLAGARTGPDSSYEDLQEAWEIAERGPMRLHMADIHLYRARLFFREEKYPWQSAQTDLEAAEKLINDCGYHRRDEELADAKRVILGIN